MADGILVIIGMVWFVVAVAVGSAASDRGRSRIAWTVFTLFTGIIGVIAYLIARGNDMRAEQDRQLGRQYALAEQGLTVEEFERKKKNNKEQ